MYAMSAAAQPLALLLTASASARSDENARVHETFPWQLCTQHARIMVYNGNFRGGLFSKPHPSICRCYFLALAPPAADVHFMQPEIYLAC